MGESSGIDLNIGSAGITGAIRDVLKKKEIALPKDVSTWQSIMDAIKDDTNLKKVYTNAGDIKDNKSYFVANACTVKLSQTAWNNILKIVKPESVQEPVETQRAEETSPEVTKKQNYAKAFNLITNSIKQNKLEKLPEGFSQALIQVYRRGDDSEGTPTVAEYVMSLLIDTQKFLGKTQNMNRIMVQQAIDGAVALCPDGTLYGI